MKHITVRQGLGAILLLFLAAFVQPLSAQITDQIRAHIDHSFIVENTTLPPGEYTFQVVGGSDLSQMTIVNSKGDTLVDFPVRQWVDDHRPSHSEISFRKYGSTEFLSTICQSGSKQGLAVDFMSKKEIALSKTAKATEHHEEQK